MFQSLLWSHTVDKNFIGQLNDLGSGAVVANQIDAFSARMIGNEVEEVVSSRTCIRVNGLVRISHDAYIISIAKPQFKQPMLQRRNVLVFVDNEMSVPSPNLLSDVTVLNQQSHRAQQNIVQINDAAFPLHSLISSEDASYVSCRNSRHHPTFRPSQGCVLISRHI